MTNFPNFSDYGYQILELLGNNSQGGRSTWLAIDVNTEQKVVLKQFRFASSDRSWCSYKSYEREINILHRLKHYGIPLFLDSFETTDGFCLIQEYKQASPLNLNRAFQTQDIKHIIVSLLNILVYLQNEIIPYVIHRDIKPENILVDRDLNVYLVDFGLAKIGNSTIAMSSIGGTFGFMPPEQLYNQKLTQASDLYSLGMTIICLVTGKKSTTIGDLINLGTNKITFKHLIPDFSLQFIEWLDRMVQPNPENRFQNAKEALEALKPIYIKRVPKVKFTNHQLEFKANKLGEKLTGTIININNIVPETVLEGKWSVAPHHNDPPHSPDRHAWISFFPKEFKQNKFNCQISIDTSKLKANKIYRRELILETNSDIKTHKLTVKVLTAPIPIKNRKLPYQYLLLILLCSLTIAVAISSFDVNIKNIIQDVFISILTIYGINFFLNLDKENQKNLLSLLASIPILILMLGGIIGAIIGAFSGLIVGTLFIPLIGTIGGLIIGGISGFIVGIIKTLAYTYTGFFIVLEFIAGILFVGGWICSFITIINVFTIILTIYTTKKSIKKGFSFNYALQVVLLTTGFGISLGTCLVIGLSNIFTTGGLLVTSLFLTVKLLYIPLKRQTAIAKYREREKRKSLID